MSGAGPPRPVPLPRSFSAEQLRDEAEELRRAVFGGDPDTLAVIARLLPDSVMDDAAAPRDVPLPVAQLAIARRYGFSSWTRLIGHVELVTELTREPGAAEDELDPLAEFCVKAVLVYGESDGPARRARARDLLAADPGLTGRSIHAAAAAADHLAIGRLLADNPALASAEGGPLGWEPLLYLCYSRLDPRMPAGDALTAAEKLLQAGADPNAGFLAYGLVPAFTALTGVLGNGELGPVQQPAHPHWQPLARMLLAAGADPNDGQALYNRMFRADNSHLELLLRYGLGTGDGGPWRRRLPEVTASPQDLLAQQLGWAAGHGMDDRIRVLAPHLDDLDVLLPIGTPAGRWTAVQLALYTGHARTAGLLVELGASPCTDPVASLVDALLSADRGRIKQLTDADPMLLNTVRTRHPSLVLRATVADRPDAVEVLVANGFDVNARGRSDLPIEQEWETALHHAAGNGQLDIARTLLELGADPTIIDARFGVTPLNWARHFDRSMLIELLSTWTGPHP